MPLPIQVPKNVLELAKLFGRDMVLVQETGFPEPTGRTGAWIFDYDPKNETALIKIRVSANEFRLPFNSTKLEMPVFLQAVDMMIKAIKEHRSMYPTLPGVRHELPPGEVYGAKLPQVAIGGTTYYRDDVKREFREVGHPERGISFEDYEIKYFGGARRLKAFFSGNVATFQSSNGESYETTNQENAVQAFAFWILNGVLKPGAGAEVLKRKGRDAGNWLDIEKVNGVFNITDNGNQRTRTDEAAKAVSAIRSWIYGGILLRGAGYM
jgi:hypothetical protein